MRLMLAFLVLESCYSFQTIGIMRKQLPQKGERGGDEMTDPGRNEPWAYGKAANRKSIKKFLARMRLPSPVALINNRGVDLSLEEKFNEAEILFREVIAEDPKSGGGFNNLGIIYEFQDRLDEALQMYKTAISLEPENENFRKNLVTLAKFMKGKK